MTGHNWQNEKSKLNVFAEVYSDIEGAIRSGKMVMVPADEVTILDWTGSGYVILSMEDYSGTYRITGGLNGGTSAVAVNTAFIVNAIITAVDMYQLVSLVFVLSDALALAGPVGLAVALGACVLIAALLTACIVYYVESVELLFAYHSGSDTAGDELLWQTGINVVLSGLSYLGAKAIGRKATSHAAEALFKALGAEACEKLIDALGVSGASGLVKMLRKAGLLDDAITSLVNGTSKNGLKRIYRCVAQNIPAEMLLYLCNHSNLLDDYTDDVLRMLGDSSYLPGVVYGMLEKYGDDFARVYQRHGDDAIEVLSKHGDELFNLPESYRHEAIDLVMSYGDEVLEGIRKHGDDFMARYVNEGETFVQEYLMKGDEVFENGAKPDGSGTEDGTKPEEGNGTEDVTKPEDGSGTEDSTTPEGGIIPKENKLALGLDIYLDDFALRNNAHTYKNFPDQNNWKEGVLNALYNPNMQIIVNLDGIDNPMLAAQRAASNQGGATDWELLQIKLTPDAWDRITWYRDGEIVPNPFK